MEPIKSRQTKDVIAVMLRREILTGAIADGEELVQEVIADKLGVSRIPVREAFQILQGEGFLQKLPNRHVRVAGVTIPRIAQNMRLIAAVEGEISSQLSAGAFAFTPLEEQLEQYQTAATAANVATTSRFSTLGRLELDFHRQLSQLTENYYLIHLHHSLLAGYPAFVLQECAAYLGNRQSGLQELLHSVETADEQKIYQVCRRLYDDLAVQYTAYIKSTSEEKRDE